MADDVSTGAPSPGRSNSSERHFLEVIEAIPEGFVLFDAEDRLVSCDERFRELYAKLDDLLKPGTRFETILRASVSRGLVEAGEIIRMPACS